MFPYPALSHENGGLTFLTVLFGLDVNPGHNSNTFTYKISTNEALLLVYSTFVSWERKHLIVV